MSQYLVSEEQVKKALQIDSFRNLSKDKIVEFASLIPHMDKDVAIAIINQFPAYVESSRNMIEQYNAMCDKVLQSNDDSRKDAVMAYKTILDDLSILLKQNGITPEQQEKITDKMILVADKIADLHEDNRNFLEGIIKYEEHSDFLRRLEIYDMNQSEFIREAISGATVKPTIVATLVSDDLLAAVGKLTAEYGRIGNNLNQIARHLNEWRSPYPAMAKELQDAAADLATLKFEVMKKVGDAVGNIQAYKL